MNNELTPQQFASRDKHITQLTAAGHTVPAIANLIGTSESTVRRAQTRTGVKPFHVRQVRRGEWDERIADLTRNGYSATRIADIVGLTERSVQRARVRTGTAQPYSGTPVPDHIIRWAATMLDDGASYAEVGRTIGRSPDRIRKLLPGRSQWKSGHQYRQFMVALDALPVPTPGGP